LEEKIGTNDNNIIIQIALEIAKELIVYYNIAPE